MTEHEPTAQSNGTSPAEQAWLARTRAQLEQATPGFDADGNWQRLSARIQAESFRQGTPRRRASWHWGGWTAWLAYGLGVATTAAVLLVITPLREEGTGPQTVSPLGEASTPSAPAGRVLQVVFRDEVSLGEVRALLASLDAEVIGGPGRLGVWHVVVPREREQAARQTLRQHPWVESVSP